MPPIAWRGAFLASWRTGGATLPAGCSCLRGMRAEGAAWRLCLARKHSVHSLSSTDVPRLLNMAENLLCVSAVVFFSGCPRRAGEDERTLHDNADDL